jgi:hypothetical protein
MRDYLGNGVYVEFDGHNIILKANDLYNPTDTIYLEDFVIKNLLRFVNDVKKLKENNVEESK